MKAMVKNDQGALIYKTVPDPIRNKGELLVEVKATALNRLDLMWLDNQSDVDILGIEIAGVVLKSDPESEFKKGDRVMGIISNGGYAEKAILPESRAMRLMDELSFIEAAAISEVFLTAYQTLFWLGNLQENETVLIHAGASGVGTAAIQLAKVLKNAQVIITTSNQEKLDFCHTLGADEVINYKTTDFGDLLENKVDVVLDFVGKRHFKSNLKSLKIDGRWIVIAAMSGGMIENFDLEQILRRRIKIEGTALLSRSDAYKEKLTHEFYNNTVDYFKEGTLKAVVDSVYDIQDVEKAHQRMRDNLNMGKIILKVSE